MNTRALPVATVALWLAAASPAAADSVEIGGSRAVISADQFTPGNPRSGTYYNASGLPVGNRFYMYVQGGQFDGSTDPWRSCRGDQILLFSAPYTTAGLQGRFAPGTNARGSNARVSPCETDTGDGTDGNPSHSPSPIFAQRHHYTAGQVFHDGRYRMISAASNYPGATEFDTLILGTSSDGVKWHWEPFIRSTTGVGMAEMAFASGLSSIYCNPGCYSHTPWWGFFRLNFAGTGQIKVDVSAQYPRGFRVWILASDNTWRQVDDDTGEFGFTPRNVWPGAVIKSLVKNGAQFELWATTHLPHNGCSPCSGSCSTRRPTTPTSARFAPLRARTATRSSACMSTTRWSTTDKENPS